MTGGASMMQLRLAARRQLAAFLSRSTTATSSHPYMARRRSFASAPWDMASPSSSSGSNNSAPSTSSSSSSSQQQQPIGNSNGDAQTPFSDAQQPHQQSSSSSSSNSNTSNDSTSNMQQPQPLHDWSRSFRGLAVQPFDSQISNILLSPIDPMDIEMKPDGLIYLPEIKYRRILNRAFGPGGWGLAPRSETNIGTKIVSREYGLVCLGRLVSVARGEQEYFDPSGIPTATEGCKSNALMRCCKDLGIASELW